MNDICCSSFQTELRRLSSFQSIAARQGSRTDVRRHAMFACRWTTRVTAS